MKRIVLISSALCSMMFGLIVYAQTAKFTSLRGFSLNYPDGWVIATKEEQRQLAAQFQSVFEKLGAVDLDRMAVVVFNPQDDEFIESINVVVSPGRMPLDQNTEIELAHHLVTQFTEMGLAPSLLGTERITFGNHEAFSIRWELADPGGHGRLRQWQVAIPGRNQTYIVTCSAAASEYDRFAPLFSQTINSMEIEAGLGGLWHSLPGWVTNAIIGALIGLLYGIISSLLKKSTRKEEIKDDGDNEQGGTSPNQEP
jgi:hypothetical protein